MKKHSWISIIGSISLLGLLLSGCAQAGEASQPDNVTAGTALASDYPPAPAERTPYTPEASPGVQTLEIAEAGFRISLPGDWVIAQLPDTQIGMEFALAPTALIDFAESHIEVIDLEQVQLDQAVAWLCGPDAQDAEMVQLESGLEAGHLSCWVNHPSTPQVDWFYIEQDGKLVVVSIQDPATREVMMEWINTIELME